MITTLEVGDNAAETIIRKDYRVEFCDKAKSSSLMLFYTTLFMKRIMIVEVVHFVIAIFILKKKQ